MTSKIYITSTSPLDELLRAASFEIRHVWGINESRMIDDIDYLPQQYCQLSKYIVSNILPEMDKDKDKLLIVSHCTELNRFHALLDEITKHWFLEIPRTNRAHSLEYLKTQLKTFIEELPVLKSVPIVELNSFIKERYNLLNLLKEVFTNQKLGYLELLEFIPKILNRNKQNSKEIKQELTNLVKESAPIVETNENNPPIIIIGEFWCDRIKPILEFIVKKFEIKSDSFENGLNFLEEILSPNPFETMNDYIRFTAANTIKRGLNPSLLDFDISIIEELVKEKNIEGVIILNYKFCDVYSFLSPLLKLSTISSIPLLDLEIEGEGLGLEQLKTRIEAFYECLIDRRIING